MMKKQGFTLAEALVTLGVIGVVAALILPAVNSMRPDQNKVLYLKAHDALGYALSNIASNSKLFPAHIQQENVSVASYPLLNTEAPIEQRYEDYTGKTKLCSLLALSMNVDSGNIDCSESSYNFSESTFDNDFNNNISFVTPNGMQWRVVPQALTIGADRAEYETDIYVDVNGNKEPNCIYNSESCTDPDRFMFLVDAKGNLYIGDPMGREYLVHRKMLVKKTTDLDDETFLASLDAIKPGIKDFEINPEPETPNPDPDPDPDPNPDPPGGIKPIGPVQPPVVDPCAFVPENQRPYGFVSTINKCPSIIRWCQNNGSWDTSCKPLGLSLK